MAEAVETKRVLIRGAVSALLLSLFCFQALALEPELAITQYGHDIWLRQNGLPASAVNHVTSSPRGYIWLSTSAGLVRFDGAQFKVIDISGGKFSAKESVNVAIETEDGSLWVGTKVNGLRLIRNGQVTAFGKERGIDDEIRALHIARDGALWIGTAHGLHVYRGGQFWRVQVAHNYICSIAEDRYGGIYVAHHGGVNIFKEGQDGQTILISTAQGLPSTVLGRFTPTTAARSGSAPKRGSICGGMEKSCRSVSQTRSAPRW